ncbi:MAG: hypothetical protein U0271_31150 [Polyangiaceae bacterium]
MSNLYKGVGYGLCAASGLLIMWAVDRQTGPQATALGATSASASASAKLPAMNVAAPRDSASKRAVNPGAVKVELYVMSQCPYGVEAENGFADVVKKLGPDLDLRVDFIGSVENGAPQSMHGAAEVAGDIAQACAMTLSENWFDFILCQNVNARDIQNNWAGCAVKTGIDPDQLQACAGGPDGLSLVTASFDRARAAHASGSPTIRIAGKEYEGGRRTNDLMRAICSNYQGTQPAACGEIPPVVPVNVIVLSDARCGESCAVPQLGQALGRIITKPVIKNVDYASDEGKKLFAELSPDTLPVVIFDKTLDADPDALAAIGEEAPKKGDYRVAPLGNDWNPRCADTDGCKLDACKNKLVCREEEAKRLDVYVMSQCPFGIKGLDAMKEVITNFDKNGEKLAFHIHYIGGGDAKAGLNSMHGQGEVDEDIRQLCAIKQANGSLSFMKYIWCRNKDIKGDWKGCAGPDSGLDAGKLESCATSDEGKELLADSFKLSEDTGISSSPTWIVNNKFKFQGVDAETIKSNICSHNPGMKGCDVKLSGEPPAAGGGDMPTPAGCGG